MRAIKAHARHYDDDDTIDLYEAAEVIVERDGPDAIRIDVCGGQRGLNYPWGRPGVSLELTRVDAIELSVKLSETTDVLPLIQGIPLREFARRTGPSVAYCGRIRRARQYRTRGGGTS